MIIKNNCESATIDFVIISIINIMQMQDQYLLDLLAVLEPNIAYFNQSVINDEWDKGLPGFETTQLYQQIKHDQMYMQKIMNIIKQASVTPNDALLKSMLLLVIKRTVKGLDKNILKFCYEEMIYSNYQIQSAWLAKFFRRAIQSVLSQYTRDTQIDYQQMQDKLVIKLINRTNLFTNLNIFVSIFKHNKFILTNCSTQKRSELLLQCFSLCSQILKQNIQTSPTIVWVCCKLLCNAWAFPQAHSLFYPQYDHSKWMQCFLQILKSKWYIQSIDEKYKNLDSLQSIYLHSKKSVVKGITNYIRKISRIQIQKKTKNKSKNKEKVEQNSKLILLQFLREIIEELEYDCYPEKIRTVQVLFIRGVVQYCSKQINLECIKRCQSCLFKFMKVKPEEQQMIVLQPYQYEIQFRDYSFFNKNIRILSASIWSQISFRKDNILTNLTSSSFQILKKLLNSTNLLEFQMALTVFSTIGTDMLKSQAQKNETVFALNTHINKMVSSSSVVIRVSAFRALCNIIDQNDLDCLAHPDFMNWIQLTYDHLTKDEAVLVRICAGICLLKLSLKEKCINQFKLIMYECLVVLLKIMQEVTLEQIGKLINQVLKIKQYEKIIMPLSKQILQYSLSSFVQILTSKLKKNINFPIEQDQDIDSIILLEECAEMISNFISNLNNNDLLLNGPIQSKICTTFCTIFALFQENNEAFQQFDQEGIESILKIFSAYLFRAEKCEQKILDLLVKKMKAFFPKCGLFCNLNLLTPLINLTKHLQLNLHPSQSLALIILVRQSIMNNQDKQFGEICLNILDFYLIANVLSVPSIQKLCPQQFQQISYQVNMSLNQKFNVQHVKSLMMTNFNGQYRSAALEYSAAVMCFYQTVISASGMITQKQILQYANGLFESLNKKIEKSSFSQYSINLLPILKMFVLANLEILSRIIFNPELTFKKHNEVFQGNFKVIPSEEISKLVNNLLLLFDKYIKNMENNELIIDYDYENENENVDLGEEVQCGSEAEMSGEDQCNEDDYMEQQQGQGQHGLEEFSFHKCFNRLEKINQNHYLNKVLENKILEELINEEQMQKLKKIKQKLDKISVQESEIVSMMLN